MKAVMHIQTLRKYDVLWTSGKCLSCCSLAATAATNWIKTMLWRYVSSSESEVPLDSDSESSESEDRDHL